MAASSAAKFVRRGDRIKTSDTRATDTLRFCFRVPRRPFENSDTTLCSTPSRSHHDEVNDRISPVFGRRCLRSSVRARCTGHSGSRTPSGFRGALVNRRPIASIARGDPRGIRTRRPSGCRPPSSVRTSGGRPPGSSPPSIARPLCRALLMFDFVKRKLFIIVHTHCCSAQVFFVYPLSQHI